ncbi:unnamed protein product [Ixodes pacificus]
MSCHHLLKVSLLICFVHVSLCSLKTFTIIFPLEYKKCVCFMGILQTSIC